MNNYKELDIYYNKFNEDKRLNTKHGQIEYMTSIKYINKYLKKGDKIIDIGAGTGKYSLYYHHLGYDVTSVELIKHNLKTIEQKDSTLKTYLANALDLSAFNDDSFDITILFGPMYHLISFKDKIKALEEAKRITKKGGYIFISYCMNEYAVITHGIKEGYLLSAFNSHSINTKYQVISQANDLYSYIRINDINKLKNITKLKRVKIIAQDGPTEYLKKEINKMSQDEWEIYFEYHLATCEDKYLLGASRHVLDILIKK